MMLHLFKALTLLKFLVLARDRRERTEIWWRREMFSITMSVRGVRRSLRTRKICLRWNMDGLSRELGTEKP